MWRGGAGDRIWGVLAVARWDCDSGAGRWIPGELGVPAQSRIGPTAPTPAQSSRFWGSLVSGGLGDVKEARAGQWDADAPLWARPLLCVGPALPIWVPFACGSLCPGLDKGQGRCRAQRSLRSPLPVSLRLCVLGLRPRSLLGTPAIPHEQIWSSASSLVSRILCPFPCREPFRASW